MIFSEEMELLVGFCPFSIFQIFIITSLLIYSEKKIFFNLIFFGWATQLVGFLVPQPGIEPTPPAMEAQSLNH